METLYDIVRFGGIGAAMVGLFWLAVALTISEKIIDSLPSNRAVLMAAAMITTTVSMGIASIALMLGGG